MTVPALPPRTRASVNVPRRTVLAGSAWAIPVVAASVAAPAQAASAAYVLTFNKTSYAVTACKTVTGASVTLTQNGIAAANQSVTISLSGDYTFASGSTSFTGATDDTGKIVIPAINAPAKGGTAAVTATLGPDSRSAILSAPDAAFAWIWGQNSSFGEIPGVPAGSTAVGIETFLFPNKILQYSKTKLSSTATSANFCFIANASTRISFVDAGGGYRYNNQDFVLRHDDQVPAESIAVGDGCFLSTTGDLYHSNSVFTSGVTSATFHYANDDSYRITYVKADGGYSYNSKDGATIHDDKVPAGSAAIGERWFLSTAGNLYYQNSVYQSGVTSANFQFARDASLRVTYVKATGGYRYSSKTDTTTRHMTVPANSTTIGDGCYLSSKGALYWGDTILKSRVTSANCQYRRNNTIDIGFTTASTCTP